MRGTGPLYIPDRISHRVGASGKIPRTARSPSELQLPVAVKAGKKFLFPGPCQKSHFGAALTQCRKSLPLQQFFQLIHDLSQGLLPFSRCFWAYSKQAPRAAVCSLSTICSTYRKSTVSRFKDTPSRPNVLHFTRSPHSSGDTLGLRSKVGTLTDGSGSLHKGNACASRFARAVMSRGT